MSKTFLYARVSSDGQNHDSQTQALMKKYPGSIIVMETASGIKARPMLETLLEQLKPGDKLVVSALDRISRKVSEILDTVEDLHRRKIIFISERESIDFSTPIGRMVTAVIASCAALERELISSRTVAGIEAARARGAQIGRPKSISDRTLSRGINLVLKDGLSITRAAKEIGVSYPYLSTAVRTRRLEAASLESSPDESR